MSALGEFVDMLEKMFRTGRYVANMGRPQLIRQLDTLRVNLENFKVAAGKKDKSEMRQLLAECDAASRMLEGRLFQGLDPNMNDMLNKAVKRAHAAKTGHVRNVERAPTKKAIRETVAAKSAELAKTMNSRKEENRQRLIAEIDTAIGRLRGLSRSLENFTL